MKNALYVHGAVQEGSKNFTVAVAPDALGGPFHRDSANFTVIIAPNNANLEVSSFATSTEGTTALLLLPIALFYLL